MKTSEDTSKEDLAVFSYSSTNVRLNDLIKHLLPSFLNIFLTLTLIYIYMIIYYQTVRTEENSSGHVIILLDLIVSERLSI